MARLDFIQALQQALALLLSIAHQVIFRHVVKEYDCYSAPQDMSAAGMNTFENGTFCLHRAGNFIGYETGPHGEIAAAQALIWEIPLVADWLRCI